MVRPLILSLILAGAMAAADEAAPAAEAKPYPIEIDLVSGEKLGKDVVSFVYEGQEFKFTNADDLAKFKADPKPIVAKLAEAVKAAGEKKEAAPADK